MGSHVQGFRNHLTEQSQLERPNPLKSDWHAYVTGIEEMKLHHNALGIKFAVLLSRWRAEDRARRLLPVPASPVACAACGARHLEHFYTSKAGGYALCASFFQRRVTCGIAQEADTRHP